MRTISVPIILAAKNQVTKIVNSGWSWWRFGRIWKKNATQIMTFLTYYMWAEKKNAKEFPSFSQIFHKKTIYFVRSMWTHVAETNRCKASFELLGRRNFSIISIIWIRSVSRLDDNWLFGRRFMFKRLIYFIFDITELQSHIVVFRHYQLFFSQQIFLKISQEGSRFGLEKYLVFDLFLLGKRLKGRPNKSLSDLFTFPFRKKTIDPKM